MAGGTVITTSPTFTTVATTPGGITVEHLVGPAAGAINATSIQDSSTNWVMQAVAFKQAVAVPDFTISVTPPNTATVAAGSPATYTISVAALNGFNSPVTLTCSGLPLGTSCAFNPPTVTPGTDGRDLGAYHYDHRGYAARDYHRDGHRNFRIFEPRHYRQPDRDCGFCDCSHRPFAGLGGGGNFRDVDRHHHSDDRFHGHGHSVMREHHPHRD